MRLAVTGTGMVTCVGGNVRTSFDAMCKGESGVKPLQAFDESRFRTKHAYEILDRQGKQQDEKGRTTKWLCAAVDEALRSARLAPSPRTAVLIGTGLRELRSLELWWMQEQSMHLSDLHFARAMKVAAGIDGPVMTFANACSASNFSLGLASDLLALGEVDIVVVGGCDSITESMFGLLDRTNPACPECVQPFDKNRRGVLLGEGAAALILESAEHAANRGVKPLAWLLGVGMSCDAHHETAPDREGVRRAITDAHRRAGVSAGQVDLVLAHGTGTVLNDQTEGEVMGEVFGLHAKQPMVTALKSMIGHTSGASGLMSTVIAVECLNSGRIPPTIGLSDPIPAVSDMDIVTDSERVTPIAIAQINAFGFGGVNAVVMLGRAIT